MIFTFCLLVLGQCINQSNFLFGSEFSNPIVLQSNGFPKAIDAHTMCLTQLPKALPAVRHTDFEPLSLPVRRGFVTAVGDGVVTIRAERTKEITTYPLHDRLTSGKLQKYATAAFGYLASDVEVGDHVVIGVVIEGKTVWCAEISILKRPGGRIPQSHVPKQRVPTYADKQNAENDWRDYGIPYPPHLMPKSPGQHQEEIRQGLKLLEEFQKLLAEEDERERRNEEAKKKKK